MLIRAALLAFAILAQSLPAAAQDVVENEALVMRLIFQDCVGFVKDGLAPFDGLTVLPLTPAADQKALTLMQGFDNRVHLLNERYTAVWGESKSVRICKVTVNETSDQPMLLGFGLNGFTDRVTPLAAAVGMTQFEPEGTSRVFFSDTWSAPLRDDGEGLRMTVVPMRGPEGRILAEVEQIIVAAGPD